MKFFQSLILIFLLTGISFAQQPASKPEVNVADVAVATTKQVGKASKKVVSKSAKGLAKGISASAKFLFSLRPQSPIKRK